MKTANTILNELKKFVISPSFIVCILTAAALCFVSLYKIADDGHEQSVLEIMLTVPYEEKLSDISMSFFSAAGKGCGQWFVLFIPVAASFAFVPVVCDERSGGNIRLSISRTGKKSYCFAKAAAAAVSAGLAVLIGYMIYTAVVFCAFPPLESYSPELKELYYMTNPSPAGYMLMLAVRLFFYGAVSAMPALLLSPLIRNKFLVICIPFMLKYIFSQIYTKAINSAVLLNGDIPPLLNALSPDSLLVNYTEPVYNYTVFGMYGVFMVICLVLYYIFMTKRVDCGA